MVKTTRMPIVAGRIFSSPDRLFLSPTKNNVVARPGRRVAWSMVEERRAPLSERSDPKSRKEVKHRATRSKHLLWHSERTANCDVNHIWGRTTCGVDLSARPPQTLQKWRPSTPPISAPRPSLMYIKNWFCRLVSSAGMILCTITFSLCRESEVIVNICWVFSGNLCFETP